MRTKTPRWYENLEEKNDAELRKLSSTLCMIADDNMRSIFDGDNETYDESDLEFWDALILRIGYILRMRQLNITIKRRGLYEIHAPHIKPNLQKI